MSAPERVGDLELRLSTTHGGRRWVRHAGTGRTLGTITRTGHRWTWAASPVAFRGDGRPDTARDGDPTDPVPAQLLGTGRVDGPRAAACAALVDWLREHRAPVLGFGPHPAVGADATVTEIAALALVEQLPDQPSLFDVA